MSAYKAKSKLDNSINVTNFDLEKITEIQKSIATLDMSLIESSGEKFNSSFPNFLP